MARSHVHQRGTVTPAMNITPLIDVVFLLIIFFMLVNNMVSEENVPLLPPALTDSEAVPLTEGDRLTVSVVPKASLEERSMDDPLATPGALGYIRVGLHPRHWTLDDLDRVTELIAGQVRRGPRDADGASTLEVRLRGDGAVVYRDMQRVLAAITAAGVRSVNIVALMDEGSGG